MAGVGWRARALLELGELKDDAPVFRIGILGLAENFAGGGKATESALAFGETDEADDVASLGVEAAGVERARRFNAAGVVLRARLKTRPRRPRLHRPRRDGARALKLLSSHRGVTVWMFRLTHRPRLRDVVVVRVGFHGSAVERSSVVQTSRLGFQSRPRLEKERIGGVHRRAHGVRRGCRGVVTVHLLNLTSGVSHGWVAGLARLSLVQQRSRLMNVSRARLTLRPDLVRLRLRRPGILRADSPRALSLGEDDDGASEQILVRVHVERILGGELHHRPLAKRLGANERLVFAVKKSGAVQAARALWVTLKKFKARPLLPSPNLSRRARRALIKELTRRLRSTRLDQIPHELPFDGTVVGITHRSRSLTTGRVDSADVLVAIRHSCANCGNQFSLIFDGGGFTRRHVSSLNVNHHILVVRELFLVLIDRLNGDGFNRS